MKPIKALGLSKSPALGNNSNGNGAETSLFHVVNPGQSIARISELYNIFPGELRNLNKLSDDKIYLGQVLKVKKKEIIKEFENKNGERKLKKEKGKVILTDEKFIASTIKPAGSNVEFPYEKSKFRDSFYMDFGFTTDLRLPDGLFYCLNGICWIEHHECYEAIGPDMIKQHYVYVNTFYMNKLGEIVSGKQNVLEFVTQRQKVPNSGAYADEIKLLSPVKKTAYPYFSEGKALHNEIFVERKYKFSSGYIYDIPENDRCYNVLKNASIINRITDTNAIYAAVQDKKEEVENILNIISVAAIPFEIPLKFAKYLQTGLEFIAYAIDLDGEFGFSDKLFDTRGPVPLSPIYHKFYKKPDVSDSSGNPVGGYKQKLENSEKTNDTFLMEEIFVLLEEELIKNKP